MVTPVGRDEPASLAFLDELRRQGFLEGQNLVVIGGQPISNEQIDKVVPAILAADPNVILTGGDVVARAFQNATRSIPLVVMPISAVKRSMNALRDIETSLASESADQGKLIL